MNAEPSLVIRAGRSAAGILLLAMLGHGAAFAADTKAPPVPVSSVTFDAFRILGERNIFNPNRVGRTQSSTEQAQPRVDVIALVGALDGGTGFSAFFDGSDGNYRKILREGGKIAEYTVTHITNRGVDLLRDGKPLSLKVGQQLHRSEGGDWTPTEGEGTRAVTANAGDNIATAIPADASDTLKRLMEKRQNQLKQ